MDTKLAQHKPSANVSMKLSRDVGDHIIYLSLSLMTELSAV